MALNVKQRKAIELLTSGRGLTLAQVAEEADVNPKTLWRWRNEPEYAHFQEELARINNERWRAAEDAARAAAIKLCQEGKVEMVKFVLQNVGYNPAQKVEAELHNDIVINIDED